MNIVLRYTTNYCVLFNVNMVNTCVIVNCKMIYKKRHHKVNFIREKFPVFGFDLIN